ncbi:DUF1592 domain-containing protein [Sorangium sp. So ce1097]|uniref:DUF1592 domain-containing protein n=1 Tax=Sorangium sp. So ce1097 TaxID=3133330 RepID=UPI003F617F7B
MLLASLAAALTAVSTACTGSVGGGSDSTPPGAPPDGSSEAFTCEPGLAPASVPLRRLSRAQLSNTVRDLVAVAAPPAERGAILEAVAPQLDALPHDDREGPHEHWGGFTRVDQTVTQEHVERSYALATAVAEELTRSPARLEALAGRCATDEEADNDDGCLDTFLRAFGERALRRAVTDEDVAFYREPAGAPPFDAADYRDMVTQLLAAPSFLYFVEHGAEAVDERLALHEVDPYELASRLAYHFWQTLPDDELLALARSGELARDDVYRTQVDRVFADPRTRAALRQFYAEWLRRPDVAELSSRIGTPAFDTLRGDLTPTGELREAMFDELADMALYYSLDTSGTIDDLYTSRKSFARSDELAALYGVPPWDGEGEPPDFVEPERQGLLTRAGMVATGSANTRPIMKGVFVRRALLCDDLSPPPANVMTTPPDTAASATSREVVTALTGTGTCAGCHTNLINPLGFATENFDALGRLRAEELLIDPVTGELTGTAPVDSRAVPQITWGDPTEVADGRELQELMLASGKAQSCFARVYFRFTFGRTEDAAQDACALADLEGALLDGAPLSDVLRRVALTPAFRQRNFGEDG